MIVHISEMLTTFHVETFNSVQAFYLGFILVTMWLHHAMAKCLHFGPCPETPSSCGCHMYTDPDGVTDFDLDCSNMGLTQLPAILPQCLNTGRPMTYHLNFSHNNLTVLDNQDQHVPELYRTFYFGKTQVLDLSFNQLVTVSGILRSNMPRLRALYLHSNQLSSLTPLDLANISTAMPHVQNLTLYSNPWLCDCPLKPFRDWLLSTCNNTCEHSPRVNAPGVTDVMDITCHYADTTTPVVQADFEHDKCGEAKPRRVIPGYVSAIIALVLLYLFITSFVAVCIVIRNRHKVKASDLQLQ